MMADVTNFRLDDDVQRFTADVWYGLSNTDIRCVGVSGVCHQVSQTSVDGKTTWKCVLDEPIEDDQAIEALPQSFTVSC